MGEATKPRCAHVAVSMAEAAKPMQNLSRLEFLLVLWRRRVYGGSCKTSVSSRFLVAVSMREAAKPRSFCCAHVAVSMEEAAKPILSRVSACPLASPCLWEKLQSVACFARSRRRVYGGSCKTSLLTSPCL